MNTSKVITNDDDDDDELVVFNQDKKNCSKRDYGSDDDDEENLKANSSSGFIVKNKYFFNDNENFNLATSNDDNIQIINEELYKKHFNSTNTPLFTSSTNKSNVTVDSNTTAMSKNNQLTTSNSNLSTITSILSSNKTSASYDYPSVNSNSSYARSCGPTNKLYETTRQNKFNSEQNSKLYDEAFNADDDSLATKPSDNSSTKTEFELLNRSRSESLSPTCSSASSSLLDDEGYCDHKQTASATLKSTSTNTDYVSIPIEDSFKKNFKKHTIPATTNVDNSPNSRSLLLNHNKYKFDKTIESATAASTTTSQAYKSLDLNSFNYVDEDDVVEEENDDDNNVSSSSSKSIERNREFINTNSRVSISSSNLKSDFITHPHDSSSAILLSHLTSKLSEKFPNASSTSSPKTTTIPSYVNSSSSSSSKSNLQSNFYNLGKTEVDKQIVYGLKSSTSSLPSTTMTTTSTTSAKGYNKFNNSNSSPSSSSALYANNSELFKLKPQSNFEIDSHGSTGTNSSNHDDSSDRSEESYENSKVPNNVSVKNFANLNVKL